MTMISLMTALIAAHILADFYLQPTHWIKQRNQFHFRAECLYWHGALHGALVFGILFIVPDIVAIKALACGVVVGTSHILIDGVKSYAKPTMLAFLLDQLAHLIVLASIGYVLLAPEAAQIKVALSQIISDQALAIATGYLLILRPVSIIIRQILRPWTTSMQEEGTDQTALESAGQYIGYLERLLVFTFILLNQLPAIGFLLAAKSVFRFGDLRQSDDKKLTEYVMLGTLSSFAITIAVGLAVSAIATQLPVGK